MFPCMVTLPSEPYCVSDLQFCDGIVDCPDGSDEPVDCATGINTTSNSCIPVYKNVYFMHI